jgi:peroxiredoxin Q/BCP
VHQQYGAFGEKSLYGRTYVGVLRSTVALDQDGKIELALYNVKATGHVTSLRKKLGI